jgi:hypothetical protein
MIHRGSLIIALLNAKEGVVPDTQNVCRRRLLLKRHPEELLIEFGSAVKVGNLYRNVVYGDGLDSFLLRRSLRGGDQCRQGKYELAAGQFAALEIAQHCFYGLYHGVLSLDLVLSA